MNKIANLGFIEVEQWILVIFFAVESGLKMDQTPTMGGATANDGCFWLLERFA